MPATRSRPRRSAYRCALGALLVLVSATAVFGAGPVVRLCGPGVDPYAESIRLWLEGNEAEALDELLELQGALRLDYGWFDTGERLVTRDPEAIVPLIGLHLAAQERQARGEEYISSRTSQKIVEDLFELYLEATGRRAATKIAARGYARMAFATRSADRLEDARDLFDRSLTLEPEDPYVLLGAAALSEKLGHYRPAGDRLQQLLMVDPSHDEAKLRLGLVQARSGDTSAALEALAAIARDGPEWMRIIAAQERAQLLASQDQVAEAIELVRDARRAHPENERLKLMLLYLLGDRSEESEELLEAFRVRPRGDTEATPRTFYNRWPAGAEPIRSAVELDVQSSKPNLARVLLLEDCR